MERLTTLLTLVKLFQSLDLNRPLPEAYKKLSKEYYTLKKLIEDIDEHIYSELLQEIAEKDK